MVKDHLKGVLNFFQHRITNVVAEGLNSKVATILKVTSRIRNHFCTAVLFRRIGLSLYPGPPRQSRMKPILSGVSNVWQYRCGQPESDP